MVDNDPITLRSVRDSLSLSAYTPLVTADPRGPCGCSKRNGGAGVLDLVLPAGTASS